MIAFKIDSPLFSRLILIIPFFFRCYLSFYLPCNSPLAYTTPNHTITSLCIPPVSSLYPRQKCVPCLPLPEIHAIPPTAHGAPLLFILPNFGLKKRGVQTGTQPILVTTHFPQPPTKIRFPASITMAPPDQFAAPPHACQPNFRLCLCNCATLSTEAMHRRSPDRQHGAHRAGGVQQRQPPLTPQTSSHRNVANVHH